jgi:hypothetical protein
MTEPPSMAEALPAPSRPSSASTILLAVTKLWSFSASWDTRGRRRRFRHAGARAAPGAESADEDRPLAHRVRVAVGAAERSLHEHTAAEGLGVADGGHGDVEARTGAGKGRDRRRDHHCGDVTETELAGVDLDAEATEQGPE